MSAAILPFRRTTRRAWHLRELDLGHWVGQRVHFGTGVVDQTEAGPEWRVAAIVSDYRQGLPIIRLPLLGAGGGRAV